MRFSKYLHHVEDFLDANLCHPIIKFIFREDSEDVGVHTHVTYKFYDNEGKRHWTWKARSSELSSELYAKIESENITSILKKHLKENQIKCLSLRSDKAQTISSMNIAKADIVKDGAWAKEIVRYLKIFALLDEIQG